MAILFTRIIAGTCTSYEVIAFLIAKTPAASPLSKLLSAGLQTL